jgi:hypothetical protein
MLEAIDAASEVPRGKARLGHAQARRGARNRVAAAAARARTVRGRLGWGRACADRACGGSPFSRRAPRRPAPCSRSRDRCCGCDRALVPARGPSRSALGERAREWEARPRVHVPGGTRPEDALGLLLDTGEPLLLMAATTRTARVWRSKRLEWHLPPVRSRLKAPPKPVPNLRGRKRHGCTHWGSGLVKPLFEHFCAARWSRGPLA